MIDPQIEAVQEWLRREDGRLGDIFGLWTQGKRDDGWVADRLVTEGHLASLIADLTPQPDPRPLRKAAHAMVDAVDVAADYEVTYPVMDAADALRAALDADRG